MTRLSSTWIHCLWIGAFLTLTSAAHGIVPDSDTESEGRPATEVLQLLERDHLPPGVVFEVMENDRAALGALLPKIQASRQILRARDPEIPIKVVTHGAEQFALARREIHQQGTLHADIETLVQEEEVHVEVCGSFAEWRDLGAEDFPDFIEVVPAAPERITEYRDAGYTIIRMRPSWLDTPARDPWEFDFQPR